MNDQAQALLDRFDETVDGVALLETTDQVRILDVMVGRLQARQAAAVRGLDSGGGLEGSGCKTVGSWTRLHLRRGVSAYRITQRAKLLPQLPGFAEAFAGGQVTDEHVDTVIRWVKPCGLDAIQAHELVLVQLAKAASAKELDQALAAIADLHRPDRDADKVAALAGRFITITALGDLAHLDAMIEPALAEALKTAVEAGATLPAGTKPADDPRTLDQRRADAFGEIIWRGIDPDPARHTGRLRPQVALTVDLEYLAGIDGAPRRCWTTSASSPPRRCTG